MPYKDPEKRRAYQATWIKARRDEWLTKNGPCVDCKSWDSLEVDHVDATKKLAHRIWSWSLARRNVELNKCVVRCTYCHDIKTAASGEHTSRIGTDAVREIRRLRSEGVPVKMLAERFGIHRSNVLRICNRQLWSKID